MNMNKISINKTPFGIRKVIIFIISFIIKLTNSQTFIGQCYDQVLLDQAATTGREFCSYACGSPTNGMPFCRDDGTCICNYPCGAQPPVNQFATDVCPESKVGPPDPNTNGLPYCMLVCADACDGGVGMKCGSNTPLSPNNIYATVCVCYCPSQTEGCPITPTTIRPPKNIRKLPLLKAVLFALFLSFSQKLLVNLPFFVFFAFLGFHCLDALLGLHWLVDNESVNNFGWTS